MCSCIYCLEKKADTCFAKAEHVLPQSFGTFTGNFTLRGIVCDACNQYFGDDLERVLARDTLEGQSRFDYGLKKPSEFRPFGRQSRLAMKVGEGPLEGAYAYRDYSQDTGQVELRPVPQVGFLIRESGKYEYFLLNEIPAERELVERGLDPRNPQGILILGTEESSARKALAEKGIKFRNKRRGAPKEQGQPILCEVEVTIDLPIIRAIGKIAFNYLAYWHGAELILKNPFDAARRFIRFGDRPNYRLFDIQQKAILADEPIVGKRRFGHLITTNWTHDRTSVLAQVSLFNQMTYCFALAHKWDGECPEIKRGHFFDVHNHEILDLETK